MHRRTLLELVFWIFTILVVVAVVFPIINVVPAYQFLFINVIYIVVAITVTRYIFLLQHTFLARRQLFKIALVFISIPLIFYLIQELNYFQVFLDEEGLDEIVGHLPYGQRNNMMDYIRSEMLLFGTASIISAVLFPFRLIVSVWRTRNRGTV